MNVSENSVNKSNYFAVIMAGGIGSRFWPVSTPENPKQFHDMMGTGKSLLQHTYYRLLPLIPKENILISTNQSYKHLILSQLPDISENQLVLEPAMRNTAPAILYATLKIHTQNPDAVILIAPSDHWIDKEEVFLTQLKTSFEVCQEQDLLMTMGIVPTYPNTGYGYIQFQNTQETIKKVSRFTEKPDYNNAVKFVESGDYLWNAGIFIWSSQSILKAFEKYLPRTYELFLKGNSFYNTGSEIDFINENYPLAENISVDYALLEKADNVKVLPIDMGWNDLGTWGALYQKMGKDAQENAVVNAQTHFCDASGNMIRTEKGKKVIIKGLHDFIVVENDGILLILPKSEEQSIKDLSRKFL